MSLADAVLLAIRAPLLIWLSVEVFRLVTGLGLLAVEGTGIQVIFTSRFGRLSESHQLRKHGTREGLLLAALAVTLLAQLALGD